MYRYVMLPLINNTPQIHKAAVCFIKHSIKSASKSKTLQLELCKKELFYQIEFEP